MNFVHCPTLELAVQPNKDYKLISESKMNIIQFMFRSQPNPSGSYREMED